MKDRVLAAITAALIAASVIVGCALGFAMPAQADGVPLARARVVDHACDEHGAVTRLVIQVETPGVVGLAWSNEIVCGKPA